MDILQLYQKRKPTKTFTQSLGRFEKKYENNDLFYSSICRCNDAFSSTELTYNFTITYRRPLFNVPQHSQHQFFLYEIITEKREIGKAFDQIVQWLNRKGYLSVREKKFRGTHIHSIVKKKGLKDEKIEKEYPAV